MLLRHVSDRRGGHFRDARYIEAELLLADARVYGTEDYEDRSPDARRLDALVLLIRRITAALGGGRRAGSTTGR